LSSRGSEKPPSIIPIASLPTCLPSCTNTLVIKGRPAPIWSLKTTRAGASIIRVRSGSCSLRSLPWIERLCADTTWTRKHGYVATRGKLATGAGGIQAKVICVGLTPGSFGLYQANFLVPQIAKGTYPVVLSIAGVASNSLGGPFPNPVMTVAY
jgi:hypothetical protein